MSTAPLTCPLPERRSLIDRLNAEWHKPALLTYTAIVLLHWGEHLIQAFQVYVLGWPLKGARGLLGMPFPWLVKSESLHYFYAIFMLVAFWTLRKGFVGRSYTWWMIAFWIQFWHHIEHALLQGQALFAHNLFGRPVPTSIVQLWIPRVELHLFYNTIVFVPMVVAMYYHMFPRSAAARKCTCAWHRGAVAA